MDLSALPLPLLHSARNFLIVELNGASSEATNICDERCSLPQAYRTLFKQWRLVFAIGDANRKRGHRGSNLTALWQAWRSYSQMSLCYPYAD